MGKFICISDLHIRSNKPRNRKDDYFKSVLNKFTQIIDLANKHKAHIICGGDFFDSVKVGHLVVNEVISILNKLEKKLYLCLGQHDITNHKTDTLDQSPIRTLLFQKNIILLNASPIRIYGWYLYGCSWGEKIQEPIDKQRSILAIHKSITPEEPPFFLKEAISADDALKNIPYKVIVSGDYHVPFVKRKYGKILMNPSPMMRAKINELELEPRVHLFDTKNGTCTQIKLHIDCAENVFLLENTLKKDDSEFKDELNELISTLKSVGERPNFEQVVSVVMDEIKPKEETIQKVKEILKNAEIG